MPRRPCRRRLPAARGGSKTATVPPTDLPEVSFRSPRSRPLSWRGRPDPSAHRVAAASVDTSDPFGPVFIVLIVLYGVVLIGPLVMFLVALVALVDVVDVVKRPDWQWKLTGQEWILLVILVNFLAIPALV